MPLSTVWRLVHGSRRTAWLLRLGLLGLTLPAGVYAGRTLFGRNLHEVIAGRVYRCAQPSAACLDDLVLAYGIRTVVNLRGCEPLVPCYLEESRASHRLNLQQEDVFFSAYRLPSVKEVHRLLEVLDGAEYPIVLHCRRGADRTGLASAIAVLLQTDTTPERAAHQLGLCYGHVALGRPANLDRFLVLYRDWLRQTGKTHTRQVFREWLQGGYCPGEARCEVQALDVPAHVRANESCVVRVRVRNTSLETWRLRAGTTAGVHAGFIVLGEADTWVTNGRAGLYDAEMRPGDSREFTLVVPPLHTPGHYRLLVDMVDEQQCWFFQAGSEPLERELEVVD
ncbi:MAG TPA: tyrosine-protein phosphatase [Gemmataceae bacterium]|nr:tyrosine-protein phosphatase [Gemmataceae bacterium]